jgi:4-amino-4-deoxy-L-arabinose transferase-like glycosyltransferase
MQAVHSRSWDSAETRLLVVAIFLFAVLVRLAVIGSTVGFHTPASAEPAADSRIHITLVENLLAGRGYSLDGPTGITPPLYIFFLAALYRVLGDPAAVRLVQAVVAAAGCLMLYAIVRRMHDAATGLIAAGLLSFYPLSAYLPGLHLTENLFLLLVLAFVWQAVRVQERPTTVRAAGLGCLLGLAILTRAVFLAFLPFVLLWAVVVWGIQTARAYRIFGLTALTAALVVSPWTLRNYLVFHAFVPVQSNSGMVFWAGNNPESDGGLVWPTRKTWTATTPPDDNMYGWRDMTVGQENALYVRTALAWIRGHPSDYIRLLGRKLGRLYGVTRAADHQGVAAPAAFGFIQTGFLVAAVVGMRLMLRSWRPLFLLFALFVFVNVTTLLFSGATRYAVPMIPSVVFFAAIALSTCFDRLRGIETGR